MKIAINGAGIAGCALAWWLRRSGHEVLLVERAPQLRSGGFAIDFWGVGYDIAEKMGLIPRLTVCRGVNAVPRAQQHHQKGSERLGQR